VVSHVNQCLLPYIEPSFFILFYFILFYFILFLFFVAFVTVVPHLPVTLLFNQSSIIAIHFSQHSPRISEPSHHSTDISRNSPRQLSVTAIDLIVSPKTIKAKTTNDWSSITRAILDFNQLVKLKVVFRRAAVALALVEMHGAALELLPTTTINVEWTLRHEEAKHNSSSCINFVLSVRLLMTLMWLAYYYTHRYTGVRYRLMRPEHHFSLGIVDRWNRWND
jgi:hypothetical protein